MSLWSSRYADAYRVRHVMCRWSFQCRRPIHRRSSPPQFLRSQSSKTRTSFCTTLHVVDDLPILRHLRFDLQNPPFQFADRFPELCQQLSYSDCLLYSDLFDVIHFWTHNGKLGSRYTVPSLGRVFQVSGVFSQSWFHSAMILTIVQRLQSRGHQLW
jgi:hypothetical protein